MTNLHEVFTAAASCIGVTATLGGLAYFVLGAKEKKLQERLNPLDQGETVIFSNESVCKQVNFDPAALKIVSRAAFSVAASAAGIVFYKSAKECAAHHYSFEAVEETLSAAPHAVVTGTKYYPPVIGWQALAG